MAWTTKAQIAEDLSVAGTELFSDAVLLKSDETAHIQVKADFPAGPTDNLEVRVYTTLDASTETWDTMTFATAETVANTTDPGYFSFSVSGVYKFRVGFKRTGATDTIVVNAWYRSNGDYQDCSLDI